jgi:TRAP-type C4-dicarboxylate transport system permease small subunit
MTGGPRVGAEGAEARLRLPLAARLFSAALDLGVRLASIAVGAIVAALFLIVASQFVDRYVWPIWGGVPADEYVKVGIIWLTFLGFGIAVRSGVAIRVDMIDMVLSAATRRWLYGAFDIVILCVLAIVLWKGLRLYTIASGQLILGTDLTVAVPTFGLLLGLGLTFLAIVERVMLRFVFRTES